VTQLSNDDASRIIDNLPTDNTDGAADDGCNTATAIAAQCWCDPETSMIEMDSRLAMAFVRRLRPILTELELERVRLAACGVVAQSNTPESAKRYRAMKEEYRSASCDDVAKAVDREMRYRSALHSIAGGSRGANDPVSAEDFARTVLNDSRLDAKPADAASIPMRERPALDPRAAWPFPDDDYRRKIADANAGDNGGAR
jgi:hypothetical protein